MRSSFLKSWGYATGWQEAIAEVCLIQKPTERQVQRRGGEEIQANVTAGVTRGMYAWALQIWHTSIGFLSLTESDDVIALC